MTVKSRTAGTKIDDQQIAGTQHEVLHFNVSSATNKTAWPQMLGVTVDFIDSDTGMAGLYNQNGPLCLSCTTTSSWAHRRPSPVRVHGRELLGGIGEGGGSHPDKL